MMTPREIEDLLPYLTDEEQEELQRIVAVDMADHVWRPLPGPQTAAYESDADIIGYGGAAGGGKTDLICGLALTRHKRALVVRREKAQTEGVVQRLTELLGTTDGYNSQKGAWHLPAGALVEFAGLDNPGDERRWQGRPHDLKAFDEVTEQREQQVRFVMGWNRTDDPTAPARTLMTFNPPTTDDGRWVIAFFGPWLDPSHPMYPTPPGVKRYATMLPDGLGGSKDVWLDRPDPFVLIDGKPRYDFDPKDYKPEDIITPKSRTFIPARVTDNPYYMATGYVSQLQSLPEPLRSQMLHGDFLAGIKDDVYQVCPTAWVQAAMDRWQDKPRKPEMTGLGVDVARGGNDRTVIAPKHEGLWFDKPKVYAGNETPDGPTAAGLVIAALRDSAPICVDVIGVGASVYDSLRAVPGLQVYGVNVSEAARGVDRTGTLRFFNLRTELFWRMREALDPKNNTGIALPPLPELRKELCAPRWSIVGRTIKVESRDDIIKRTGRSPDLASAYVLALIDVPKISALRAADSRIDVLHYDPLTTM